MTRAPLSELLDMADEQDEPWFLEPKDRDPRSEEKRQAAVLRDAKIICPAVNFFAVPNGAKRSQWEAMKAKREGMKSGAVDLVATWPGGVAFIEMKNGTDMPNLTQREQLNTLYRQGHRCGVFRNERTVLDALRRWGAPFIGEVRA